MFWRETIAIITLLLLIIVLTTIDVRYAKKKQMEASDKLIEEHIHIAMNDAQEHIHKAVNDAYRNIQIQYNIMRISNINDRMEKNIMFLALAKNNNVLKKEIGRLTKEKDVLKNQLEKSLTEELKIAGAKEKDIPALLKAYDAKHGDNMLDYNALGFKILDNDLKAVGSK